MSRPNSKANEDYYSNEELCPNCHTNEKLYSEKISMSGKIYCKNCGWEGVLDDLVFKQADGSYGKESKASETQDDFDWLNEDDDRFTATMWEQSDGTWIVNSEGSQFDSSFTTRFTDSVDAHKYMDKVNRGELTKDDLYNDQMSGYRILESKASESMEDEATSWYDSLSPNERNGSNFAKGWFPNIEREYQDKALSMSSSQLKDLKYTDSPFNTMYDDIIEVYAEMFMNRQGLQSEMEDVAGGDWDGNSSQRWSNSWHGSLYGDNLSTKSGNKLNFESKASETSKRLINSFDDFLSNFDYDRKPTLDDWLDFLFMIYDTKQYYKLKPKAEKIWKQFTGESKANEGYVNIDDDGLYNPIGISDVPSIIGGIAKGYGKKLVKPFQEDKSGDWEIQVKDDNGEWKTYEYGGHYFGKDGADHDAKNLSKVNRVVRKGSGYESKAKESSDVFLYEPANDVGGVGYWWDFELPLDESKERKVLEDLDIQYGKAWGYLTQDEKERVSNYKSKLSESTTYKESWNQANSIKRIEALEKIGIKQGDAIKLSSMEFEDFGEDLQGALKGDVEDARRQMKSDKDTLDKEEPFYPEDSKTTGLGWQEGGEVDNPNSEFQQYYPDYNNIGESQTNRTKYECEYCDHGFKSNEALMVHHNDKHAISKETLDGYATEDSWASPMINKGQTYSKSLHSDYKYGINNELILICDICGWEAGIVDRDSDDDSVHDKLEEHIASVHNIVRDYWAESYVRKAKYTGNEGLSLAEWSKMQDENGWYRVGVSGATPEIEDTAKAMGGSWHGQGGDGYNVTEWTFHNHSDAENFAQYVEGKSITIDHGTDHADYGLDSRYSPMEQHYVEGPYDASPYVFDSTGSHNIGSGAIGGSPLRDNPFGESRASESFDMHSDAGHGWLEVPKSLLKELGISKDISMMSYQKGNSVFIEEDGDLSTFKRAYEEKYGSLSINELPQTDDDSPIRDYYPYGGESKATERLSYKDAWDNLDTFKREGILMNGSGGNYEYEEDELIYVNHSYDQLPQHITQLVNEYMDYKGHTLEFNDLSEDDKEFLRKQYPDKYGSESKASEMGDVLINDTPYGTWTDADGNQHQGDYTQLYGTSYTDGNRTIVDVPDDKEKSFGDMLKDEGYDWIDDQQYYGYKEFEKDGKYYNPTKEPSWNEDEYEAKYGIDRSIASNRFRRGESKASETKAEIAYWWNDMSPYERENIVDEYGVGHGLYDGDYNKTYDQIENDGGDQLNRAEIDAIFTNHVINKQTGLDRKDLIKDQSDMGLISGQIPSNTWDDTEYDYFYKQGDKSWGESKATEAGLEDHSCPECGFITSDNSEYVDHLNAHEE